MTITLSGDAELWVHGDATRLRSALSSILLALRRELVTSDQLVVHVEAGERDGQPCLRITIGEAVRIAGLRGLEPSSMAAFDEWRGGNGLSLPNACRIIEAHGGRVWSPTEVDKSDGKASAVVVLPSAG